MILMISLVVFLYIFVVAISKKLLAAARHAVPCIETIYEDRRRKQRNTLLPHTRCMTPHDNTLYAMNAPGAIHVQQTVYWASYMMNFV